MEKILLHLPNPCELCSGAFCLGDCCIKCIEHNLFPVEVYSGQEG